MSGVLQYEAENGAATVHEIDDIGARLGLSCQDSLKNLKAAVSRTGKRWKTLILAADVGEERVVRDRFHTCHSYPLRRLCILACRPRSRNVLIRLALCIKLITNPTNQQHKTSRSY